jgi:ankyrin repeat protein
MKINEFYLFNMNTIILFKNISLTNNINEMAMYYKNIYATNYIKRFYYGFPKISYTMYNDIKYKDTIQIFSYAIANGHLEIVKYLINEAHPRDIIDQAFLNNFAIGLAASNGHLDVVDYLISLPKSYGIDRYEAIERAICRDHIELVKYLLSLPNIDIDQVVQLSSYFQFYISKNNLL